MLHMILTRVKKWKISQMYIYTDTMFTSNPNYLNQEYQEVERFSFSHPNGPTISLFFVSPLVFIAPGYSREAN